MADKKTNRIDFESYIRHGEPEKKDKAHAWAVAIGLQQVDGLTPSAYLFDTAKRNIEGEISIEEAGNLIDRYYESKMVRADDECTEKTAWSDVFDLALETSRTNRNLVASSYIGAASKRVSHAAISD